MTEEGEFQLSSQTKYHPKTDEERLKVDELLAKQAQGNPGVKQNLEQEQKADHDYQSQVLPVEEKEKSLEGGQETSNNSEQNKKAETKLGDFPEETQVAAPLPEANVSQPLNDLSPSQTRSQPLLHFSINEDRKSIHKDNYHPISDKDLLKLNRYASHLQNAAQWYLENVADSKVTYFYQDGADVNSLAITYTKESFMHLTGIYPYREGQTAEQTLLDFSAGNGQFDNILIANRGAAFDKLKVLPELPAIVDAESFYFGDLSDVEKFHSLNLDKAIRSNDQDVLLAFRTVDGTVLPASLMRLRKSLNLLLDQTNQEKIILGVFREQDGHIEQLSINEEYVKDGGEEMLSVLKNRQFEEIKPTMNVDHQVKISSYNFNNQEYSDLESMLQAGASYLQTPEGKAWLLEDKEYHQDILLKNFESKVSTPKQKLAVMSELGSVRVNGYELLPGMAYYDALRDDGKYLDNEVIKRIDDELLNLSSGVSAEEELHYEKQLIDLAESRGIAEQENHLNQTSLDSATFTQVLDTVYNENYHVRLQWVEERPDGPKLPFKETELISYQDFAKELYKANQSFYQLHQEGVKQVTGGHPEVYTSPTKIQFSIYAPNGELIQDSIRYNIGEEINPIAHKERLGTREMRENTELMKIDRALFNQYNLERLASKLDISQFSYALEDTPYADQLLSQVPYGVLENSPIGFSDSSHDSRLGFISFDGMDSVEVENLSAWFEKLGVRDSPQEQIALVEKWQKEIKDLSEKVEQTIENIRDEFEKTQVKNSQNTLDNPYEKIYQYNRKDERDRDLDGDGISNSDEMLQGTDPYNAASNLHKKQEDRERRTDSEVDTGAIITETIAAKSSEQTISQLVANKDTKALAEHLKEGMKNYLDSEQFRSFLDTMSKFHNYSLNNIHLLKMQNPNVSHVASFNKWKTDFERTVKKGSKALKIWVPYQVKTKISANQNELSFSPSENEMEEKEVTVTRFKLGSVFDVSQTEGKELPKAINELTGSVKDYEDLYRAAKAVSMDNQVSISFEEIKREGANGYYSPDENRIVISKGLKGQEHILKTIFHEMAHSDLHRGTNAQYGDDQYRKQELQAESVAYVVANHFGFDTSSYSFGYLAIWAKDKNGFEDMVEQLQIVQKEAKSLINRMDAKLELVKNKSVTKDKFADKLKQAKEKSEQLGSQKAEAVKQVEEKKFLSSPH